jgi:hypothetical protein
MRALLFLPALLAACASSYMQPAEPGGRPGPEESRVIFCRPSRAIGGAVNFPVWDELKLLGFSESGTWFEYRCPPGKHYFVASAQSYKGLAAELAGGKTYYVWITPRMGFLSAAVGFTAVSRGSEHLEPARASLKENECRKLLPEKGATYETKRRETIREVLGEFKSGAREAEPGLKPDDGLDE